MVFEVPMGLCSRRHGVPNDVDLDDVSEIDETKVSVDRLVIGVHTLFDGV